MVQVFDVWRLAKDIPDLEKYDNYISDWYARILDSKDEDIRTSAADSLYGFYLRKQQYEKAEEYLMYFSKQNPERKRKQAVIYSKTNRVNEAYKAYEELVFTDCQMINMVLQNMYMLAVQDKDMKKAHYFVDKQKELARIFEMGEYHEVSLGLDLAAMEKNVDTTIETMEKMLASIGGICGFCNSALYEHMTFKEPKAEFLTEIKNDLLKCFQEEETFGFLKENKRWQELLKKA